MMDMDGDTYLRFILALVLVLGLLVLAAWLLRRSGLGPKLGRSRRLSAVESLPIGPRHRLLLVRRDNVEHLLLLGPQGDLVVEGDIMATPATTTGPATTRQLSADVPADQRAREPNFGRAGETRAADTGARRFADMVDEPAQASMPAAQRPYPFNESH